MNSINLLIVSIPIVRGLRLRPGAQRQAGQDLGNTSQSPSFGASDFALVHLDPEGRGQGRSQSPSFGASDFAPEAPPVSPTPAIRSQSPSFGASDFALGSARPLYRLETGSQSPSFGASDFAGSSLTEFGLPNEFVSIPIVRGLRLRLTLCQRVEIPAYFTPGFLTSCQRSSRGGCPSLGDDPFSLASSRQVKPFRGVAHLHRPLLTSFLGDSRGFRKSTPRPFSPALRPLTASSSLSRAQPRARAPAAPPERSRFRIRLIADPAATIRHRTRLAERSMRVTPPSRRPRARTRESA